MSAQFLHFVYDYEDDERLDKFLVGMLPEHSRSRLQTLIQDENVSVNGRVITKTGFKLTRGDTVQIILPPIQPVDLVPEDIPLDIIHEDSQVLIINKPAGMVVHPSAGHSSGTLVHAALAHAPDIEGIGGELRPGIVHRLDKNTSGLILIAKNDQAQRWLQNQFRSRTVGKTYLALVDGHPPTPKGRIEAAIGRDPGNRKRMAIVEEKKGKIAYTEYFTLERFADHTYLEVKLLTGRTHQIRLHMAFLGCPVVGDTVYGKKKPSIDLNRHFLHSAEIQIILPGKKDLSTFRAPLPQELEQVLHQLRSRC